MNQFEEWYFDIPVITRVYVTGICLMTAAVVSLEYLTIANEIHFSFSHLL